MKEPEDIFLVARVTLFGDKRAFDALVMRYQSPIRRFFLNQTLGDKYLSDDLAQDTFIKVYTYLKSFKGSAKFSTWLYRIAYNIWYDHLGREKKFERVPIENIEYKLEDTSPSIEKKMDIYSALKTLNVAQRTALTLFYMEDMPQEKIAVVMGCPLSTVKTHISRGKERMLEFLKGKESWMQIG